MMFWNKISELCQDTLQALSIEKCRVNTTGSIFLDEEERNWIYASSWSGILSSSIKGIDLNKFLTKYEQKLVFKKANEIYRTLKNRKNEENLKKEYNLVRSYLKGL